MRFTSARWIKIAFFSLMVLTASLLTTSCVLDSLFIDILNNPDLVFSDSSTNNSSVSNLSSISSSTNSTNSVSSSSDGFR